MSVVKTFLLGLGGAAIVATGVASTAGSASAQTVAAGPGACDEYAREYAAVHAPRFGAGGWDTAYRHAYNQCVAGGPSFVAGNPFAAPFAAGAHVAGSALHAGANIAGTALHAGANIAGTALSLPGAILGGTASALAPPPATTAPAAPAAPTVSPTADPVQVKNYRGTYEEAPATTTVAGTATTSTAALAADADVAPPQFTPEWYAYCEAKYNSFNPETGMYLAYSGTYRMCN